MGEVFNKAKAGFGYITRGGQLPPKPTDDCEWVITDSNSEWTNWRLREKKTDSSNEPPYWLRGIGQKEWEAIKDRPYALRGTPRDKVMFDEEPNLEKGNYADWFEKEYDAIAPNPDSPQGQINRLNIELTQLKLEVTALKKANNWFATKVISIVALYNIIGAIVERVGNSYGWW